MQVLTPGAVHQRMQQRANDLKEKIIGLNSEFGATDDVLKKAMLVGLIDGLKTSVETYEADCKRLKAASDDHAVSVGVRLVTDFNDLPCQSGGTTS